jgi:hypothetical protein
MKEDLDIFKDFQVRITQLKLEIEIIEKNMYLIAKYYLGKKYNLKEGNIYHGSLYSRPTYFIVDKIRIADYSFKKSIDLEDLCNLYYTVVHYREVLNSGISRKNGQYTIFNEYYKDDFALISCVKDFSSKNSSINLYNIKKFHNKLISEGSLNKIETN